MKNFEKLKTMNLNNNNIYKININSEIDLPSIENIYFNDNVINEIKIRDFVEINYENLNSINFFGNKLTSIWFLDDIKMDNIPEEVEDV